MPDEKFLSLMRKINAGFELQKGRGSGYDALQLLWEVPKKRLHVCMVSAYSIGTC